MANYTVQDLEDNLDYLQETKNQIKSALINKGASISNNDTFRSYVNKINNLDTSTGGKALWYVHDINSLANIEYTNITNVQSVFNTGFIGNMSNILTPGNYYANQKSAPNVGDLVLINSIRCRNSSNYVNVYCFGTFSNIEISSTNITAEVGIRGGYLL